MVKKRKLFDKMLNSPQNIRFDEFIILLQAFGFISSRIKGSHHIFTRDDIMETLSIQPTKQGKAKPYQIRQFIKLIEQYAFQLDEEQDEEGDEQ